MAKDISAIADVYFERFDNRALQLEDETPTNLALIVVIPCHNEPALNSSLQSLKNTLVPENVCIEVITVVNHGLNAPEDVVQQNQKTIVAAKKFAEENNTKEITFQTVEVFDMPPKKAGVGLARKTGMDEALRHFSKINKDGIIVCFDADSLCEENYFVEIIKHFKKYPKTPGCSIHFEHPIEGNEFSKEEYDAIILYELHLRYYKNALQYSGLPFVYHTIGSSMAVRASAYAKQGGMNKRKAGEDFYFLNKIIQLGNFSELNSTKVIPSPRISDRVPFGTGRAVGEIIESSQLGLHTYDFQIFNDLKEFVSLVSESGKNLEVSNLPFSVKEFIDVDIFMSKVAEIAKNSTSEEAFVKRFFKVFDAFWVLKYVHFARDNFYKQVPVLDASNELLLTLNATDENMSSEQEALALFREIDKQN